MNSLKTFLLLCFLCLSYAGNAQDKFDLLIGTYTSGTSTSEGIYVYSFDSKTGELEYKNEVKGIDNPSYLTISPDHKNVYAISESGGDRVGMVHAYDYDSSSGKLTFKNKESAGGQGPCYVSVDKTGSFVFTANYGSGSLAAIPILKDESLGSTVQAIYNKGNVINGSEGPSRMHAAVISPDNNYLFAPNLGIDKIGIYRFDSKAGSNPLTPAEPEFINLPPGSGPRHFTFHPNGKYAYVIQELDGGITSFDYEDGKLSPKQTVSILPAGFEGKFGAADIHISPDGKFLYGSNRIDINEIVIYSIDQNTGMLTFVGRQSSMGEIPRNFVIDPTGDFLLVANQNTNNIVVFKRDQKTGLLTPTDVSLKIDRPVCLKFVY
jgi:6-phosphogluconolactonase